MNQSEIQLLACQVENAAMQDLLGSMEHIIDIVHAHEGTVFHIFGPLILATFDFNRSSEDEYWRDRVGATMEIKRVLGNRIKALHGAVSGTYANMGPKNRLTFGPVIPGFEQLLQRLLDLPFGEIELI